MIIIHTSYFMLISKDINVLNDTNAQNEINNDTNNKLLNEIINPFQGLSINKKNNFTQKLKKLPKITTDLNDLLLSKLKPDKKN